MSDFQKLGNCGCLAAFAPAEAHREDCPTRHYAIEQPDVAAELLRLDAEGEAAGWDGPLCGPWLFMLARNDRDGRVRARGLDLMTQLIDVGVDHGLGVGLSLIKVAESSEFAGAQVRQVDPDGPLLTAGSGWTVTGIGLRSEAWTVVGVDLSDEQNAQYLQAAEQHTIDKLPEGVESRFIQVVTIDGLLWWLNRDRGREPILITEELSGDENRGGIPHALARIVNSAVSHHSPVPVPALAVEARS